MGTITGTYIFTRVSDTLLDASNVRWPIAELLRYLNDGQRAVALVRPDASSIISILPLAQGSAYQSITTVVGNSTRLLDITRNMGTGGVTPGSAVRLIDRKLLDLYDPKWAQKSGTEIKHFIYDPKVPHAFWVYPFPSAALYVELAYAFPPPDLAGAGSVLSIDDAYAEALGEYVLYRAYSKDAEFGGNDGLAQQHMGNFSTLLGVKGQTDSAVTPK